MQRSRTFLKGYFVVVSLMLLAGLFMSCRLVQAQLQTEQVSNQIRPEIKAQLQDLKKEIVEKGYTFTVGYNPAMEYAIPELCGLVVPKDWRRFAMFEDTESYLSATPTSYDWRDFGGNTPVKNQGSCGSCWAFGTVAPLEMLISIHCNARVEDLSEQYLVSCNENNWSCSGGWFAHDYHQSYIPTTKKETNAGAVLDANFPYTATNAACNGPHSHPYKINSWSYVAGYSVPSVAAIKQAIQTYGPVSTSVCVGSSFQAYRSGIFNANETCSGTVNHAVALVGWNDDVGPDNGYWILKNSWGTGWGESGYMRIRYGISKVGYATNYINFSNCGTTPAPGLNCASATALTLGTLKQGQTTVGGQSNVSTYGCSGRTETGPEKVYTVTTTKTGDLTATLSNMTTGLDLDVFILSACNPTSCLAFGDTSAKYANAPAGTYYIVVDGNNGASGPFSLQTALATALPDLTGAWTSVTSYSSGKIVYGTLKVSNIGGAAAGKFNVAYYLSTSGTSAGTYVSSQTVSNGLAVGGVRYLYPVFSATTSLKGKYLRAVIDYDAKIAESNENNNVAVSGGITKARPR